MVACMREVPPSLRTWFVIHFIIDVLFAAPLFVAPRFTLGLFGWAEVDPVATRLVAAALFGIGIQSFLGRQQSIDAYLGMLNLKIIWSLLATAGIFISLLGGAAPVAWVLCAVFAIFNAIWITYRWRLR